MGKAKVLSNLTKVLLYYVLAQSVILYNFETLTSKDHQQLQLQHKRTFNTILTGATDGQIRRLQAVQNAAARLVSGSGARIDTLTSSRQYYIVFGYTCTTTSHF